MICSFDDLRNLQAPNDAKIFFVVLDGLGGLPRKAGGRTELETAHTPAMDDLARQGMAGMHVPVAEGITPGSGPGHLGILGYDPLAFNIGRGALAAAGIDFDLQSGDVAARGNFCTLDKDGRVTDRRAGRIETKENKRLCEMLRDIHVEGIDVLVEPIKEHRFLLVLRGNNLSDAIDDTDPQATGIPPKNPLALKPEARKTVEPLKQWIKQVHGTLHGESAANMVLLRGFASRPDWPRFAHVFGLHAAAVANYPMYRGLARLLGMDILPAADTRRERVALIRDHFNDFDFFFIHHKPTDSAGEDGDFEAKVHAIEEADKSVAALQAMRPSVLIVTGDHSTPAILKSHSWHPVPTLLWSEHCRPDGVTEFGERACLAGAMGPRFPAKALMPLALAHAWRLKKFGS